MKGALEELNEPVDDLMEVSKVQTQILNLTHNQVDIFDKETETFRSTYDIMKDIADVWDSLNSTSQASLTEILFGKNRANVGLALIQAYQSGQVEDALNKSLKSEGTAIQEYEKMMEGIQSHTNALKGALQELANTITKSDTINSVLDKGKGLVNLLNELIKKTGSLAIVLAPLFAMITFKTGTSPIATLKTIVSWFVKIEASATGATKATIALGTATKALGSALLGIGIAALISWGSKLVDSLITTKKELKEMASETTDAMVDLNNKAEELNNTKNKLNEVAENYSKISTTVTDLTERQTQLQELQQDLTSTYKDEAEGIDLVNGKYSEQIKKIKELREEEEKKFRLENADKIAEAQIYSQVYVDPNDFHYSSAHGWGNREISNTEKQYYQFGADVRLSANEMEAMQKAASKVKGIFNEWGSDFYLSGNITEARDQLAQFIEEYKKVKNVNIEALKNIEEHYAKLNALVTIIEQMQPYLDIPATSETEGQITNWINGVVAETEKALTDAAWQPFYDNLDEAQQKLQNLANPENLSMDEYVQLQLDVEKLNAELYQMAGNSAEARQEVDNLFNGFNYGIKQNDDGLEKFVQRFESNLEGTFKETAEIISVVQEGMENLGEGKGLAHTDAWKLLKEDSEGYLKTIKIINGEYYFAEEELIKFKDAKIEKSKEELRIENEKAQKEMHTLSLIIEGEKKRLLLLKPESEEYAKSKIAIEESEKALEGYSNTMMRNNYLIEELNQNLGDTRTLSVGMATELNNTIKGLENEVKAIEKSVDELNARKDALESEKKVMEDELDILNEQKETLEETLKNYDAVADAVNDYVKSQTDGIQEQIDALEKERKAIEDYYNDQIDALKEQNEERDDAIKKEKALADLANAENQKRRVYSSARGWTYETSKEDIVQAQNALAEIETNEKIKALEKERDAKLGGFDERKEEYETQIEAFEEYAKKYADVASDIQKAENELLADQILGSEWRTKIEQQDETLLNNYRSEYQRFNNDLKTLVKDEIANLQASIDKKDEEIKKIDKQIEAYNRYKNTVETKLSEAKTTLENYKKDVVTYCDDMATGFENMENRIWEKHNRIIQWFREVYEAAEGLENKMAGSGIAHGAMYLAGLGSFANGGTIDYTGLAMVHGSKSNSETAFNATDSKKLYDMVHNTPNLIASIVKQSGQLGGFNPSNITNRNSTNNSSINVNIGQVVANNPAELTRNLDTHLDGYFRRKLTQGYAQ